MRCNLKAKINIYLKAGILDPQGKAVMNAIEHLGYEGVVNVRIGKYVEMEFNGKDSELSRKNANEICQKLLSNPLMENYSIEFEDND
jgi:phosphoribosylformylglycinamidine synthase PurS subunit